MCNSTVHCCATLPPHHFWMLVQWLRSVEHSSYPSLDHILGGQGFAVHHPRTSTEHVQFPLARALPDLPPRYPEGFEDPAIAGRDILKGGGGIETECEGAGTVVADFRRSVHVKDREICSKIAVSHRFPLTRRLCESTAAPCADCLSNPWIWLDPIRRALDRPAASPSARSLHHVSTGASGRHVTQFPAPHTIRAFVECTHCASHRLVNCKNAACCDQQKLGMPLRRQIPTRGPMTGFHW